MRFGVLGPLLVEGSDGRPVTITSHRQRAVLAVLLLAGGRAVSADRLIDDVWGDELPVDPANTLQHAVAQLRKALEPDRAARQPPSLLVSTDGGYRLELGDHRLDATELEQALADATRLLGNGDAPAALQTVDQGIALWRGPAYADFTRDDLADGERQRLAEQLTAARELAADCRATVVGPEAAIGELEALVAEHPQREGSWARLMTALYRAGRQADALRAYQRAGAALGELGLVVSPSLAALEAQILSHDPALLGPASTVANNVPTPTNQLIGREQLLGSLLDTLRSRRVVTLLGPGGSGKTRLALEAARALITRPPGGLLDDGVWLVRLDDLTDPTLLDPTVSAVLAMPESAEHHVRQTLVDHLSARRVLIVLDNCEHLLPAVADLVSDLVVGCPTVTVLATSQAPLDISAEQRVRVPPLGLPGDDGAPFAALDDAPAVGLFLERARQIDPGRSFDDDDLRAVANIVQRLDGMPLAIELAAARTDSLTPTDIARFLADRFALLTTGPRDAPRRQQTLRAAVAWSQSLLDDAERAFFVALTPFVGGFDLAAAAAVSSTTEVVALDLIGRLVNRSLLTREPASGRDSRFRLLETLRQSGLGLLADDPATHAQLRRRHAHYFADQVQHLDRELVGPGQAIAFRALVADDDNLRAAMAWSLEAGAEDPDDWEPGVRIAAGLGRLWDWRGMLAEADTWLSRFTEAVVDRASVADLALLVSWHAFFTAELGDRDRAEALTEVASRIAVEQGDKVGEATTSAGKAMYARLGGDPHRALTNAAEVRRLAAPPWREWFLAWADNHDALARLALGDLAEAAEAAGGSYRRFEALGDRRATGWALTAMAQVSLAADDLATARQQACRAVAISVEANDGRNAAWASELAAAAARGLGDADDAASLEAEAAELLAARGMPLSPWQPAAIPRSPGSGQG